MPTRLANALSKTMIAMASTLAMIAACASTPPPPVASPTASASSASSSSSVAKSSAPAPLPTTLLPGVGMSTSKVKATDVSGVVDDDDGALGPAPPAICGKDEDCWSRTCCPAKEPEDCVHASRARKCAIVDIQCKPSPMHYTCVCESGACKGRLAPP